LALGTTVTEEDPMPKFLVCFRVEQTLSGSIEFEADNADHAAALFAARGYCPAATAEARERIMAVDDARREAKLDLEDSEDSITEVKRL
jgi:hypothetical protein